jgi:hypothetical protein
MRTVTVADLQNVQVLVAVASHGWAMPRFLDRLAMDFEQDLVEAEVELDRQGP